MSLSISHLEKFQESKKLANPITELVDILLAAINDWPNPIINLDDYEKEIYKLMGNEEINRSKLENYLSQIDYSKFAWEAESLSQLLDIFNYYEKDKSLKEIMNDIRIIIEE